MVYSIYNWGTQNDYTDIYTSPEYCSTYAVVACYFHMIWLCFIMWKIVEDGSNLSFVDDEYSIVLRELFSLFLLELWLLNI